MGTERTGLYGVLRSPFIYSGVQNVLGSKKLLGTFVSQFVKPFDGASVLDIGAGTGLIAHELGSVDYLGIEPNPRYVEAFNIRKSSESLKMVQGTTSSVRVPNNSFDIVIISAVLHHLDDNDARSLLSFATDALRNGGHIVTIDPVFHQNQRLIARFLATRDRGRFVRSLDSYQTLFSPQSLTSKFQVRTDLMRIPYSHVVAVATKSTGPSKVCAEPPAIH